MATVRIPLDVRSAIPPATNGAQLNVSTQGSLETVFLAFDAAVQESVQWQFKAANFGASNTTLAITIIWNAASAIANDVVWGAQIAAVTPDVDSGALSAKSFGTASEVTDTHLGTNASRPMTCTITLADLNSLAADDIVWLSVYRKVSGGMVGDAQLLDIELSYSDA